eukprot:TRINITY_DN10719_c0_g1_i1.p1 TRINITY_DN10719_c0_g1~~TRINITY_DN10719_c0_g1_i1.p1  ORF type:complete len:278 (+),score=60.69 TRINITY_DN10719_c0_g1_i1:182-1015(+)
MSAELGAEQTNKLHTRFRTYSLTEFVSRIRNLMQGAPIGSQMSMSQQYSDAEEEDNVGDMNWAALGKRAFGYFKITPQMNSLYGSLDIQPRETRERKRFAKEKLAKKIVPEEVKDTQSRAEMETSRRVEVMKARLNQSQKLPFFKFIIDPDSYSRTVENLFHLSFLVKDGQAAVAAEKQDDSEDTVMPVVAAEMPPDEGDYVSGKAVKSQCIIRLDHEWYQKMIKDLNVTQSYVAWADGEDTPSQAVATRVLTQKRKRSQIEDGTESLQRAKKKKKK